MLSRLYDPRIAASTIYEEAYAIRATVRGYDRMLFQAVLDETLNKYDLP